MAAKRKPKVHEPKHEHTTPPEQSHNIASWAWADNARHLYKSGAVIVAGALTVLNGAVLAWASLQGVQFISADLWLTVNAALGALVIFVRYIKQPALHEQP